MVGNVVVTCTAGTPNTCTFDYSSGDKVQDSNCTAFNDITTCSNDSGTNDVSTSLADNTQQCIEFWNLASPDIQCVRMQGNFSRPFVTTDTANDIDIRYGPMMVSAGWKIAGQTTVPLESKFDRQIVDFGRFLRPAPESDYNGAVSSMGISCAAVAAAVVTFMF